MTSTISLRATPRWYWIAAGLGLAWNVFGVAQFLRTELSSRGDLIASGLTPAQADLSLALPLWMDLSFAVGVFGGVLGSVLLLLRHRAATPVLGVSLAAYVLLFIGDIVEGVFAAFGPPQVAILSTVVLIAAGLLWLAARTR